MAKFSVSLWIEIEANSYQEAHSIAGLMEEQIVERVSHAESTGIIDVECQDPEELEEEGDE